MYAGRQVPLPAVTTLKIRSGVLYLVVFNQDDKEDTSVSDSEMAGSGSGQGHSDLGSAGAAGLREDSQSEGTPAGPKDAFWG